MVVRSRSREIRAEILLAVPFMTTVLDALMSYFLASMGWSFRVGLITLAALVVVGLATGLRAFRIRDVWVFSLVALCIVLLWGVALIDDLGTERIFKLAGIPIYFMAGYVFCRWVKNPAVTQSVFLVVGALYVVTCIIALMRIWPAAFPVVDAYVLRDGGLVLRPEIMTDQNFQVLYLVPVALGLIMATNRITGIVFGLLVIGAAYVLAQVGSRSGILVFGGLLLIGLIACIPNPSLGRRKALGIPILGVLLIFLFLPVLIEKASLLLFRFSDTGVDGALGRLRSTTYLFEKILQPSWWVPRGVEEFQKMHGDLPHSTMTASFLDGGLPGLILWCLLILRPAILLGRKIIRGGMDSVAAAVACGGIAVLVLQFSLYAITVSQVWVWSGCVIGVLERLRAERRHSIMSWREAQAGVSRSRVSS